MHGCRIRPRGPFAGRVMYRGVLLALVALACVPDTAFSQSQPGSSLTDPRLLAQYNALETAAAYANQATYDTLQQKCFSTSLPDPSCSSPQVLAVYRETQELVQTADALLGNPSSGPGLGLDVEGLRFALRWTAAEEMAAQGASISVFAASQMGSLAARLSALRFGVTGARTTFYERQGDDAVRVASSGRFTAPGGAASADEAIYSPWSWYLDGSFGFGDKAPTDLEDAFDFDGQEITTGLDYRFSAQVAAGAMLGYTQKEIDFDSSQSVVDGGIETDGLSVLAYGLWESDHAFVSGAIGYQQLTHDTNRRITYPSQNPLTPSTDSLATSSTDSSSILASLGTGYAMRWGAFSFEPGIDFAYTDSTVDGFIEESQDLSPNANPNDPFALKIGQQSIESLDAAVGFKVDYAFTPAFGVLVPYASARYHKEMLDDARRISARYADAYALLLEDIAGDPNFAVPTDEPDDDYFTLAGGVSIVLQSGIMGFLQYLEVLELDNYNDTVITGGVRYEFGR
jgi:uncharacterized protein YhjY with autotransporter beta-barrel domain